ncbi:MAG: protein kinase [Planctomycetota bacterium]
MPAPSNATDFLQLLELSNLVEEARVRAALSEAGLDASQSPTLIADALVRAKILTRFQAEQLLAGRHRGFFIGKYRILDLVGSGGMGRVYLAEHAIMRRQVALKVLPKAKSAEPSALARFQREARAVAALNHANIIQAYDIDQEGDIHYMVMEYVDGMSVQEYVKHHGVIPYSQAADYICQACDALEHANKSGLIHRDIKPGNLLIDMTGTIKLLDMGLAVFYEEKDRDPLTLTYDENVLGTADYLAPEQALDSHNVDIRADIYSLGGTFYYMLTGGPPFPDGTIAQKLLCIKISSPNRSEVLFPACRSKWRPYRER